jgi:hypothetical protein
MKLLILSINSFCQYQRVVTTDHPKIDDALKLLHETYIGSVTEMKIIPVTETEIISIIRSLKNKKKATMEYLVGF